MKYRIKFEGSREDHQREIPPDREFDCSAIPRVGEVVQIAGFWYPVWLVSHEIDDGKANTACVHLGPPSLDLAEALRCKDEERYLAETRHVLRELERLTSKCLGEKAPKQGGARWA